MRESRSTYSWIIALALAAASVGTAHAGEKKTLTAAEITEMVSGNTLSGVFGEKNTRYAQRNHANGIAVIHVDGSPIRFAPWFVKEPNSYCEDWEKDGILCYKIGQNTKSGDRYFIYPDGSTSSPVKVQEGLHPITFK